MSYVLIEVKEISVIAEEKVNLITITITLGLLGAGSLISAYIATGTDTEDPVVIE